jgi:hypothetical protein
MSDELIEGRALRGEPPIEDDDRQPGQGHQPPDSGPDLALDLPFIVLEPPPEAGNVMRRQMDMATRPAGLEPIDYDYEPVDIQAGSPPPLAPPPVEPVEEETEESVEPPPTPLSARPEPPGRPVMHLPAIRLDDEEEEEADQPVEAEPPAPDDREASPEIPAPPFIEEPDAAVEQPVEEESDEEALIVEAPELYQASDQPEAPANLEEVVDAEWVVEFDDQGGGKPAFAYRQPPAAEEPVEEPTDEAFYEAAPPQPMDWKRWAALAGAIILIGLVIFVPGSLRNAGREGREEAAESNQEGEGSGLPVSPAATLPPISPTAPATPLPAYAQGRVIFASDRSGNFDLYVMEMLTRQVSQLTEDADDDRWPGWSPDGSQIVFVSDRAGNDDLYVMDASGQNVVQLTTDGAMDRYPAWSPDGSRIAFAREDVNGSSLLLLDTACIAAPDGCEDSLTPVTVNRYDLHPAWSPDGSRIAFAASDFPGLPWVVALFDLDSGTYSPLPGTGSSDRLPAWSPDGSRIGFISSAEGAPDVWVMSESGEVECQLTFNPANDVEIAWSPGGDYLVFASDRGEEGDFELYLIRADCDAPEGGPEANLIQLTDNDADDFNPAWLP